MQHTPHELYISLMIIRDYSDMDIFEELELLGLEKPEDVALKQLRSVVPVLKLRQFKRTQVLMKWADSYNIDHALLNIDTSRVQNARAICFHSKIKHMLELCLLHWQMSWEDILETLQLNVSFKGLNDRIIQDYGTLFWSFDRMSNPDRMAYFKRIRATAGMWAAQDGFPALGVSLDMGVPFRLSEVEKLQYMKQTVFMRYAEDMHTRKMRARDAKDWMATYLELSKEVDRLQPAVEHTTVVFDAGVQAKLPSIDQLLLAEEPTFDDEEDIHATATVVPFTRK